MAILYYRDPADNTWKSLNTTGAVGPAGPPGPQGPPGPEGPAGSGGGGAEEVEISDAQPVDAGIELWVAPDGFQGELGWDGFDNRYVKSEGDTMSGHLSVDGGYLQIIQPSTQMRSVYGVWAGGAIVQSVDDSKEEPDRVTTLLQHKPGSKQVVVGSEAPDQAAQIVRLIGSAVQAVNKDGTPFVATWPDHVTTKKYVDSRVVVSATEPPNPTVGMIWATP